MSWMTTMMTRNRGSLVIATTSAVLVVVTAIHVATSDDISFGLAKALVPSTPIPTSALQPCPAKAMNCIRTTWRPPSSSSSPNHSMTVAEIMSDLQDVFRAYPQQGQNGVDQGGWTWIDQPDGEDGKTSGTNHKFRMEYQSNPKGFFARLINGGQPFIDDVLVEIVVANDEDSTANQANKSSVEIRSSSRQGLGDMKVNQKRLMYLGQNMTANKGWSIPPPQYPS